MYAIVVGGGKVGLNLTRELLNKGAEVTLIEQRRDRFNAIEAELEYVAQYGDGTELWVLERAGISLHLGIVGDGPLHAHDPWVASSVSLPSPH